MKLIKMADFAWENVYETDERELNNSTKLWIVWGLIKKSEEVGTNLFNISNVTFIILYTLVFH